jgi:hypothetical protein
MIKNKNTNIEEKSTLAKLLATENIEVQENAVPTASFDVTNRVLTIPTFEEDKKSKYVYDMLVGHEVAHALWTDGESWIKCAEQSNEFKSFVNVLEDCRIDKKIQKRYPGLTNDYIKGFDKLYKDNFFQTKGKNLNDYMIIDKINLYFKSSKKLNISFDKEEKEFVNLVDKLKTFEDVKDLATKILGWTKDKIKKTPDFDKHAQSDMYKKEKQKEESATDWLDTTSPSNPSDKETADSKIRDFLKKESNSNSSDSKEQTEKVKSNGFSNGAGGDLDVSSITDSSYTEQMRSMIDKDARHKSYLVLPNINLKEIIIPYKTYLIDNIKHYISESSRYNKRFSSDENQCQLGLAKHKETFDKFIKDSYGSVNYMVKEFEMKKNARLHARTATSKTGVIDVMKLHTYKFSEDIFKKISIVPNEKNHGMIMLLDWSGSMSNHLLATVEQLISLVMFTKKINIPFTVYKFVNNGEGDSVKINRFSKNHNDAKWDQSTNLVELFTHRQSKKEYMKVAELLHRQACYYDYNYGHHGRSYYNDGSSKSALGYLPGPMRKYYLNSTPLNEALVCMNTIIAKFKDQYKSDKVSLITLTDGGSNGLHTPGKMMLKLGKNYVDCDGYGDDKTNLTNRLITYLKKKHGVKTIGFFLASKYRDLRYLYRPKLSMEQTAKSMFNKDKVIPDLNTAYDVYFYVNASVKISNESVSTIVTTNKAQLKREFSKGMKKRLTSRVLLNKFIEKVA